MARVGFEPTIPVFERAKTVHALDLAATVIGFNSYLLYRKKTAEFLGWNFKWTCIRFDFKISYNRSETIRQTTGNCIIDKDECTSLSRLHCHNVKAKSMSALCHVLQKGSASWNKIIMALQPFVGPWTLFQFFWFCTQAVWLLGRGISPCKASSTYTQNTKRINAHKTDIHALSVWQSKPVTVLRGGYGPL
jgi:hypothetical protein